MFLWGSTLVYSQACGPCGYVAEGGKELEYYADCVCPSDSVPKIKQNHIWNLQAEKDSLGWMATKDFGWFLIHKNKGIIIWGVATMDNGPDYFADGLVRIQRKKKWGFADSAGKIIVAPIYDGALPFENGSGKVCVKCRLKCNDKNCEQHSLVGGTWLNVTRKGIVRKHLLKSQ